MEFARVSQESTTMVAALGPLCSGPADHVFLSSPGSNLEWARGYGMKFGVTVVDREDGCKRYPKKSALMLRDVFKHITAST